MDLTNLKTSGEGIAAYGVLFRDNSSDTAKIVLGQQVDGGYFVCEELPKSGSWREGQLCYCIGTTEAPVNKFFQYNGESWVVSSLTHNHPYAGSASQGGPANSVANPLIITLNGGEVEGGNKFTYDGSTAKTVNITSPGVDRGIEKSGDNFVLNQAFYDYLLEKTFATPSISSFSLIGTNTSGSKEVGTTVTVTGIKHQETNVDNIDGALTLSRKWGNNGTATAVDTSITKSSSSAEITVNDSYTATSNGTLIYTLSAPHAYGEATATKSISFYWPVFYGATALSTPSGSTDLTKADSFGSDMLQITTDATNKHIHFLSKGTIKLYNSLKLPITPGATGGISISVNGQSTTYNFATIQNCSAGTQQIYVNI